MTTLPLSELITLVDGKQWAEVVRLTTIETSRDSADPSIWFFNSVGLFETGNLTGALQSVRRGLAAAREDAWGNKILFDLLIAAGQTDDAFGCYGAFIRLHAKNEDVESSKAWFVERAADLGQFELATEMNETRAVITKSGASAQFAIALQCYIKSDTLESVFQRLLGLNLKEPIALAIRQDSLNGLKSEAFIEQQHAEVQALITGWMPKLVKKFSCVEYAVNPINLGTAPTCRRLLDDVSGKYSGFIFIEDDCLLSPSALQWATHHVRNSLTVDGIWFATCETIFFDSQGTKLSSGLLSRLLAIARNQQLKNYHVTLDFVPSTCFATTSEIWRKCAAIRSFTRGPESLSKFLNKLGHKTLAPVVPHAQDIGMLHELGYSRNLLGANNVREVKTTYLEAEGHFDHALCKPYAGDLDLLFSATSYLNTSSIAQLELSEHRAKS